MNDFARSLRRISVPVVLALGLAGCLGVPKGAEPVTDFEIEKYLGTWYEIARLDHSFERGLSNVTAQYSLLDNGGVRVINRGYNNAKGEWDEAEGKAYFVGDPTVGMLKVSFFGPFYGAYNVIALDEKDYQWSLVAGPDTDYLWILSRSPQLDEDVYDELVAVAASLGFDTGALIVVDQSKHQES